MPMLRPVASPHAFKVLNRRIFRRNNTGIKIRSPIFIVFKIKNNVDLETRFSQLVLFFYQAECNENLSSSFASPDSPAFEKW